jgi:hypothetical protein
VVIASPPEGNFELIGEVWGGNWDIFGAREYAVLF